MEVFFAVFWILVLLMSVVIHEVSHGYVAELLGDPTARLAGRLTLNPVKHLDPFGSVILPFLLVVTNLPAFGWARPVPYNPYNLRNGKYGPGIVALAGPFANILIALCFTLLIRSGLLSETALLLSGFVVFVNLLLAFFNLIPIPPLDGAKVLSSFLPYRLERYFLMFEELAARYGFLFLIFVFFLAWQVFLPALLSFVSVVFQFLSGIPANLLF